MTTKKRPFKKFIIVALALVFVELGFILFYSTGEKPNTFKAAMESQIANNPKIPVERRSLVRIQLALNDFRIKNNRWPQRLEELVPEYFDSVPLDPQTAEPFKYRADKTRYYLGETKEAPAAAGKGGKQTAGAGVSNAEEDALVASLDRKGDEASYVYDPTNKRDPFRSYDFTPRYAAVGGSPLTQFSYDELTLTAVLEGLEEPKAIVEDPKGRGYTVTVGTDVGNMGGKIVKIEKNKIVILESTVEFTGEKRTRTVELYLR